MNHFGDVSVLNLVRVLNNTYMRLIVVKPFPEAKLEYSIKVIYLSIYLSIYTHPSICRIYLSRPVALWTGKQIFSLLLSPNKHSGVQANLETKVTRNYGYLKLLLLELS